MRKEYWYINSNRSKSKRFVKKKGNKHIFFEYMYIDSQTTFVLFRLLLEMKTRKELEIDNPKYE